jgi:hypothetical protein
MYSEESTVPNIKIMISSSFLNKDVLIEVICGLEEESVPYDILISDDNNADSLAYEGSVLSVLGVGIGLDGSGYAAVHMKSLPVDSPLFKINYIDEHDKLRATCSNAARLVKGIPFIL